MRELKFITTLLHLENLSYIYKFPREREREGKISMQHKIQFNTPCNKSYLTVVVASVPNGNTLGKVLLTFVGNIMLRIYEFPVMLKPGLV